MNRGQAAMPTAYYAFIGLILFAAFSYAIISGVGDLMPQLDNLSQVVVSLFLPFAFLVFLAAIWYAFKRKQEVGYP